MKEDKSKSFTFIRCNYQSKEYLQTDSKHRKSKTKGAKKEYSQNVKATIPLLNIHINLMMRQSFKIQHYDVQLDPTTLLH